MSQREVMEYDCAIVGAGPAGLSAAIRLKQLAPDFRVCVLEKGAEVGAHILSGAVFDPRALGELLPDWKERAAPMGVPVSEDAFYLLTQSRKLSLPLPRALHNHGNYVLSLGALCRWLAQQAEALGVEIFPGFPAAEAIIEHGAVAGVVTGAFGIGKNGEPTADYQPGVEVRAAHTLLAEGCRGSVAETIIRAFDLRKNSQHQTYGLGIKEIWRIDPSRWRAGEVVHTVGWPLGNKPYGGGFAYHAADNTLLIGLIAGLDYENPYFDPFMEFQRMKTHPLFRALLEGGTRIAYGARTVNEGGWQSLPTLSFPGGALLGCSAGFLNVARIKGSHLAMKSGMLAAEAIASGTPEAYEANMRASWAGRELHAARNFRPGFRAGLWAGMVHAGLEGFLLNGRAPWTIPHGKPDHACLKPAAQMPQKHYPRPDGRLTFDRMSSVYLSNTNHGENQPPHLKLKDATLPSACNLPVFGGPEQRYCPAGVYEYVDEKLHINAQNCVHCKACDIKDPKRNIVWTVPEGGGGPNYGEM